MNVNQPIYTEQNNCQDCYKCIRHCPVKAIRISNDCASVIDEVCIACGKCVEVCPVKAKKVRSDLEVVKMLIRNGKRVVVSLAPSWVSEFEGVAPSTLIAAIKRLGVFAVSETALGAEMVNRNIRSTLLQSKGGVTISSACPAIVDLVRKHYPQYYNLISPVLSPAQAHAQYLKDYYGDDTHVVFVGPCIAKKRESDSNKQIIDAALTFDELRSWLDDEWIELVPTAVNEESYFEPVEAVSGAIYPVEGGMIEGIRRGMNGTDIHFMSFSGMDAVRQTLAGIEEWDSSSTLFLELLACAGGCINGPGVSHKKSIAVRRGVVAKSTLVKMKTVGPGNELISTVPIGMDPVSLPANGRTVHSSQDIAEALKAVGKLSVKDELNCGGCGYESCNDFAIAMLEGKAERNMCVSYMRRVAHDKATVLLQRIPSGVLLVDENLRVLEGNQNFARMLGSDAQLIFDVNPGMGGADVTKLVPFHKFFSLVLRTGKDIIDRDVKLNGHLLKVSVFSVQQHKIVCAIVRDLYIPEVRSDEVVRRTRFIIKENLETVQKIAYLLGENASRTETMLNSILESFNGGFGDEDESISC